MDPCHLCGHDPSGSDHDELGPEGPNRRSALQLLAGFGAAAAVRPAYADQADPAPTGEYIIEAGWLLSFEKDVPILTPQASILISGDRIVQVSSERIRGNYKRVDASNCLVTPGFISGHTHACTATPTRGLIESKRRPNPRRPQTIVEELSDEDLDALTAYNVAELVRSGTTTQVEMSLSLKQAKSYVRVAEKWGVRGYPGGMIPGSARLTPVWYRDDDTALFESEDGTLAEIEENLAFAKSVMGASDGRIMPMMSPHATDTHTPKTMQALAEAVKELGTGLHIHLSQSITETERVQRLWGMTPTEWVDSFGLLDGPAFVAHMGGIDWETDPDILIRTGAVMAHCPSAGGAGGFSQNYPEALAAGLNVNIGIDTHSNDYVENLKLAVLYGQARYFLKRTDGTQPVLRPTIEMALAHATLVPARGLRRTDLGNVIEGAKADIVCTDVSGLLVGPGSLPPEPLNNLLYANGLMVQHVITDGRIQVYNGRLVADDEQDVVRRGGQVMASIYNRLEAEAWF